MVAKYYGRNFELSMLREYCYLNKGGAPLLGVNDAAERIGFRCMGVKSSFGKFAAKSIFPCIVHWRNDHYVVVYKVKVKKKSGQWTGKVYVADPAFGKVTYTVAEFLDGWISGKEDGEDAGVFLMLVPTLEFFHPNAHAEKNVKTKLSFFLCYITPYKKFWIQIILGMVMGMVFSLIFPFL